MQLRNAFILGAAVLAGASTARAADTTPPTLVGLTLLNTTLNVAKAPATSAVSLDVTDDASGIGSYTVGWLSPSGLHQMYANEYSEGPKKAGTLFAETLQFSIWAEAGAWKVVSANLCDRAGNCHYYGTTDLDPINPSRTVTVTNASPDTTPPTATSAVLLTPSVSLSASTRMMRISLKPNDDKSGAYQAFFLAESPSHAQNVTGRATYSHPAHNRLEYVEVNLGASITETGAWTITQVAVYDVANNSKAYTGAALDTLFGGGSRTINVTN